MSPFNHDIKSFEDVKKEYPRYFDLEFLKHDKVKKFIEEELNMLVEDSLDEAAFRGVRPKSIKQLRAIHLPTAQAKALYRYLWAIEHITDQMVKWGWNGKDITTLIKRMEKAGYDPYSTTEDTAGQFIESLKGHGFKKITTKYGDEYMVYNPKGYD
jgi:hypothetical protein